MYYAANENDFLTIKILSDDGKNEYKVELDNKTLNITVDEFILRPYVRKSGEVGNHLRNDAHKIKDIYPVLDNTAIIEITRTTKIVKV